MKHSDKPIQLTRQKLLHELWNQREMTVDDLARRLNLSPMTIRHHLAILERDELVESVRFTRAGRVGRPRLLYHVTPAAADMFPSNVGCLAEILLDETKSILSEGQLDKLLGRIALRLVERFDHHDMHQPDTHSSDVDVNERLDQIVGFLNNMGYAASWSSSDVDQTSYVVQLANCPYGWIARKHSEICRIDQILLATISRMSVDRLSEEERRSIDASQPACFYRLTPSNDLKRILMSSLSGQD